MHTEEEIDEILNSDQQMSHIVTIAEVKKDYYASTAKKAQGIDLVTAEFLKQLPKKGIVLLIILYNAIYSKIVKG
ncbi:unnamed protein product [Leptidea sinapis]|uniref:Uncharacterized protein n=1 Tax=Leptidea sinapis TaxID=189913 RepID=A0A5E4QBA9_9NEOP|nr:unnamed protein product [Leptidea sinapis]